MHNSDILSDMGGSLRGIAGKCESVWKSCDPTSHGGKYGIVHYDIGGIKKGVMVDSDKGPYQEWSKMGKVVEIVELIHLEATNRSNVFKTSKMSVLVNSGVFWKTLSLKLAQPLI